MVASDVNARSKEIGTAPTDPIIRKIVPLCNTLTFLAGVHHESGQTKKNNDSMFTRRRGGRGEITVLSASSRLSA